MSYIGIDIGTTTISGLLIQERGGREIRRKTVPNTAKISADVPWKSLQDPRKIWEICRQMIAEFSTDGTEPVQGIGFTGQMHGILYLDAEGEPCSELISWQDERANQPYQDGTTYSQRILQLSGYPVATGCGIATIFYDTVNRKVPPQAVQVCTITDFAAMRAAGQKRPLTHASNAASLGMFSLERMAFDTEKIRALGIDPGLLPKVTAEEEILGYTGAGCAVAVAIGDNQASFLGAVGAGADTLINIGTGSQISKWVDHPVSLEGLECRPYLDHNYLIVGSSLCGGSSYHLLMRFLDETVREMSQGGCRIDNIMQQMDRAAEEAERSAIPPLKVDTRFRGTRACPEKRGSISNIQWDNFTVGNLCLSFLRGICEELYGFYTGMGNGREKKFYVASGNAARNSEILRRIMQQVFGAPIRIPQNAEEAAYGAAALALHAVGKVPWAEIKGLIRYDESEICL